MGMSNLTSHMKQISREFDPIYGRLSPGKSVDRLLEYYQRLNTGDKCEFVSLLISEFVALKAISTDVARERD